MRFESNIDEIIGKLEQMKQKAEDLSGKHIIPFSDLFIPEFMDKYTDFKLIDEMLQSSGFAISSSEDIEKLPQKEWNDFIQKHTKFPSWNDMIQTARNEYFARKLGLK